MMAIPFPAESVANEEGATVLVWYASLASDFGISLSRSSGRRVVVAAKKIVANEAARKTVLSIFLVDWT